MNYIKEIGKIIIELEKDMEESHYSEESHLVFMTQIKEDLQDILDRLKYVYENR